MNTYEITFITKEDLKEPIVKKTVEALGGRILSEVKLGQKNFVYPIRKEKSGFYTSLVFEIDPLKVQDLNKKLLLEEEILRFLIVTINVNQEMTEMPTEELKPEEITGKPEDTTAIIEPETEIIEAPVTEIEVVEPVVKESLDSARDKIEEEKEVEESKEEIEEIEEVKAVEKTPKTVKKVAEKPAKEKSLDSARDKEKPVKKEKEKTAKPEIESTNEEERLEALDKKLEELLKD